MHYLFLYYHLFERVFVKSNMAEAIAYGMAGNILSTLTSHVVKEVGSVIRVKKELKKLERTLISINSVLKDADEQQLITNHELKDWVQRIKDACYDAEDVVDEFSTEALRQDLKIRDSTFKKVWSFSYSIKSVSFHFKMSRRIKEIGQKFIEIEADKNKFHLVPRVVEPGVENRWRETIFSEHESEVFGRDDDKNEIIKLLSGGDGEFVVAIVGMGGIGKTTLAQLVYSDEAVDDVFELKMWVGVYGNFDVKKILEEVIKSVTKRECPNLHIDELRLIIQNQLKGKKFLLVLDDVWNEDNEKWEKLKFVLSSGAGGSRVVVTTRSTKVAIIMGAKQYMLAGLSSSDCWKVFEERAFAGRQEQAKSSLLVIGKEMVGRCHGVPLAAKTLGSLMRLNNTEREWEAVRDSDIWNLPQKENDIMPSLRVSYNHLPIYLKQCFAYFAVWPKDGDYDKNDLLQSWIAHGFVRVLPGDCRSLEDVGDEYVKELLWRSLIQEPTHDSFGNLISFKVHDLLQNLAKDVAGTEFILFEESIKVLNPEEIRYGTIYGTPNLETYKGMCMCQNVREVGGSYAFPYSSFKRLRCIRTNNCPDSISKLVHLRKLCLIDVQIVSESVTKLLNLQTFDLSYCSELKELPMDIGKMVNLRHIYFDESAPVSHMPLGFKNLTSLRTLTVFFVGNGVGCKLNELHKLEYLEGGMVIKNLENVCDARDCGDVNLKEKKRLENLKFSWNNQDGDEEMSNERSVDVLENLQPHPNLKILVLEGYLGSRFASWMTMKPNMFPKLLEVSLVKCRNIENLSPFGELPVLRDLLLKNMDAVKTIEGRCGNGSNSEWFPSLKKLRLENLANLESFGLNGDSLPSLVEGTIIGCPRLESMPLLTSVERVEVVNSGSGKLMQSLLMLPVDKASTPSPSLVRLKFLEIKECSDLISLPENWSRVLTSLEELVIENCSSLVSLEDESNAFSTRLLSLFILELPKLVHLPRWFRNLTEIQTLCIEDCDDLIHVPAWFWELTSLRTLQIMSCVKLKPLPDGMQSLTALEELTIVDCSSWKSWPNGLGSLVSLKSLTIGCTSNLPSLPEELQQLTALRELSIFNCETMLALPEWLRNFTSLQSFTISVCKNIKCLPDWFPELTALQLLIINECDELTSRCQKGTGEDWQKISHIPYIILNDEWIQGQA